MIHNSFLLPVIWLQNKLIGRLTSLKREDSLESVTEHKPVCFATDIVRVNVCGQEHFINVSLLSKFPNTLLGSEERERYFRKDLNSYYFDRNRHAFDAVMGYYLSGGVFMYPAKLNREVVHREMQFYKIPVDSDQEQEVQVTQLPEPTTIKEKAHVLLNYPKSSQLAMFLSLLDCFLIFLAVTLLILETEPQFKDHFENPHNSYYKYLFWLNTTIIIYFTLDYLLRLFTHPSIKEFFKMFLPWLDLLSILPFYIELLMMPFTTPIVETDGEKGKSGIVVLRICRIFRVTRVFKFARRSENLLILLKAVGNTYKELILLSGVVSLAVVSFGSIMYTIESLPGTQVSCKPIIPPPMNNTADPYNSTAAADNLAKLPAASSSSNVECVPVDTKFNSILMSCWWAVITVTTVGYGDMIPMSTLGKCMGSFAVFCGLIIIALPATIIVTRFSEEYEKSKMQSESGSTATI